MRLEDRRETAPKQQPPAESGLRRVEVHNVRCDLSEEGWRVQRQQLAWTVGAALGRDVAVRVVDGTGREVLPTTRPERSALAPGVLSGGYGPHLGWSTRG